MTIEELPPAEALFHLYGIKEEIKPSLICKWFGCSLHESEQLQPWHKLFITKCARCGKIYDYCRYFYD